jgi:hypothetical protein
MWIAGSGRADKSLPTDIATNLTPRFRTLTRPPIWVLQGRTSASSSLNTSSFDYVDY